MEKFSWQRIEIRLNNDDHLYSYTTSSVILWFCLFTRCDCLFSLGWPSLLKKMDKQLYLLAKNNACPTPAQGKESPIKAGNWRIFSNTSKFLSAWKSAWPSFVQGFDDADVSVLSSAKESCFCHLAFPYLSQPSCSHPSQPEMRGPTGGTDPTHSREASISWGTRENMVPARLR